MNNELKQGEVAEFLYWKEQLSIVAETSVDGRYFFTVKDKVEFHLFADASELVNPYSKPKESSGDLAVYIEKVRVAPI